MLNVIELSQALINQQSVTPDDNGCQTIVSQHLKELGFDIVSLDQQGSPTPGRNDARQQNHNRCLCSLVIPTPSPRVMKHSGAHPLSRRLSKPTPYTAAVRQT